MNLTFEMYRWMMRKNPFLPFRDHLHWLFGKNKLPIEGMIQETNYGFLVRLLKSMDYQGIYVHGDYEPFQSKVFTRLIKSGDSVIDIGANFGWYTLLFSRFVGKEGIVHSFEPVPHIYSLLINNLSLNSSFNNIKINNIAIGDNIGTINLNTFKDRPDGHASIHRPASEHSTSHHCPITTIDMYLEKNLIQNISFIKMDIEGHEFEALKGAQNLLNSERAPVIAFEVNEECVNNRKLDPNCLLEILRSSGYSNF